MSLRRNIWLIVSLSALVPLGFAVFTNHIWEDFFITFRSSRNLVEGHGLVYNPGERVHTYTSPLGVLLPALCLWLSGLHEDLLALWEFRLVCIAALAGTAALLARGARTLRMGTVGMVVLFGLLIADPKLNDFSINGMETPLMVFFLVWLWKELETQLPPRPGMIALGVAGLQWTRPDAFILTAALIIPHFIFQRQAVSRRIQFRAVVKGIFIGICFYIPWILWAWRYYGTPIPNTIVAKKAFTPVISAADILHFPARLLLGSSGLDTLYLPTYDFYGGWPKFITPLAHVLGLALGLCWLIPKLSSAARRLSLTLFLGTLYLSFIVLMPWYIPPWTVLASIALGLIFNQLHEGTANLQPAVRPTIRGLAAAFVCAQVLLLAASAWQMRQEQRYVENGVRRQIGLWLHAHAQATDTVFLEPLGYIGYFSNLKTYDIPGLSSPEVVAAVKSGKRRYSQIIEALAPTWLVLRPHEFEGLQSTATHVLENYMVSAHWNAKIQLDAIRFLPGRPWCEWDSEFLVLRRIGATTRLREEISDHGIKE